MPKVCTVCGTTYPDSSAFCPADGTTLRSADVDGDLIGSVVADRYLVTDLLGEGGMGRVYLARHLRLPQQAAIKVLRPSLLRDPASVARFNREASNASRIEHERVARVFDFGETSDGTVYLAMEYVPGRTLKKLLADEAPLPPLRSAALVKQVADGLDAAHRMGIVHRDLKPDNILVLTDDVTGDRAKIVDFGIAKAIGGDTKEAGLTQTGFVVGTPEFMAPEQMLGGTIDGRTDMYALALVAFQCLTNVLPFDTTTPDRGLTARLTEEPRRLDGVASGVHWSPELQAVFDQALARDIDKRFPTAGAFADALSRAVHNWVGVPAPLSAAPFVTATAPVAQAATPMAPASPASSASSMGTASSTRSATRSRLPMILVGTAVLGVAAVVALVFAMKSREGDTPPTGKASVRSDSTGIVATPPSATLTTTDTSRVVTPSGQSATGQPQTAPSPSTGTDQGKVKPVSGSNPSGKSPERPVGNAADKPSSGAAKAAHDSLNLYRDMLRDLNDTQLRNVIGKIQALLPRMDSRSDSAWAFGTIGMIYATLDEQARACEPLRQARRLSSGSRTQDSLVTSTFSQLTCRP